MVIILRVEVSDEDRKAIAASVGSKGMARRSLCAAVLYQVMDAHLGDLKYDMDRNDEREAGDALDT